VKAAKRRAILIVFGVALVLSTISIHAQGQEPFPDAGGYSASASPGAEIAIGVLRLKPG